VQKPKFFVLLLWLSSPETLSESMLKKMYLLSGSFVYAWHFNGKQSEMAPYKADNWL